MTFVWPWVQYFQPLCFAIWFLYHTWGDTGMRHLDAILEKIFCSSLLLSRLTSQMEISININSEGERSAERQPCLGRGNEAPGHKLSLIWPSFMNSFLVFEPWGCFWHKPSLKLQLYNLAVVEEINRFPKVPAPFHIDKWLLRTFPRIPCANPCRQVMACGQKLSVLLPELSKLHTLSLACSFLQCQCSNDLITHENTHWYHWHHVPPSLIPLLPPIIFYLNNKHIPIWER